jgi:hypothetical protein
VLLLAGVLTRAAAIGQPAHNRQPAQGAPATALWRFR